MNAAHRRLLLVEDDAIMGESLAERFRLEGYECDWVRRGDEAVQAVTAQSHACIISDFRLPDTDGEELFRRLLAADRELPPVVFITAYGAIERAVQLLKMGAADYLTKPFDVEALLEKIARLCVARTPREGEACSLGPSSAMRTIEGALPRLARLAPTVLLTGESGVGKETVARALHDSGGRGAARPFVAVNCGALPEGLLEAELFGHEKGAFTGSVKSRRGVFEQAHGGTLFLDEIAEMPFPMQVKLLRAIEDTTIVRLGGETPIKLDIRLICATNRDLKQQVDQGCFREDLYYRINLVHLRLPPLRERGEDVLWLASRFLAQFGGSEGSGPRALSHEAQAALLAYPWPGNVRELKHCIQRACILTSHPVLQPADLFEAGVLPRLPADAAPGHLADYLTRCERAYILNNLERFRWHMSNTASGLGISRKNLWEKMKKLGIQASAPDA